MRIARRFVGWLAAFAVVFLKKSCRVCWHDGHPRPELRKQGMPYVYGGPTHGQFNRSTQHFH